MAISPLPVSQRADVTRWIKPKSPQAYPAALAAGIRREHPRDRHRHGGDLLPLSHPLAVDNRTGEINEGRVA
jgi:hypothetical protein